MLTVTKQATLFTQRKSWLFTNKMKKAAVVSFRAFLLFSILLMLMRLGVAVPLKDDLGKEGDSYVDEYNQYMMNILYCTIY